MLQAMMIGTASARLHPRFAIPYATFSASHNPSKDGPKTYDLARRKIDKLVKQSPAVKTEFSKQIRNFNLLSTPPNPDERRSIIPPDQVLKSLDTDFESFFFKRPYTERNFCFYLQLCAQQYKPELALVAFERMQTLGIAPTDHTYTQLQLAYAKKKDLDRVLELHAEATEKHGIAPSVNRMSTVLLAYCKAGELWKAEDLLRDMRENMGLVPDVVCYTTLIDGYAK